PELKKVESQSPRMWSKVARYVRSLIYADPRVNKIWDRYGRQMYVGQTQEIVQAIADRERAIGQMFKALSQKKAPSTEVVREAPVPPPQRPARAAKPVRWLSDLLTRASSRDTDTASREK
ncbi:hypothetical protein B4Q13_21295, partial [Lacticaseibacillus rhamnosus]